MLEEPHGCEALQAEQGARPNPLEAICPWADSQALCSQNSGDNSRAQTQFQSLETWGYCYSSLGAHSGDHLNTANKKDMSLDVKGPVHTRTIFSALDFILFKPHHTNPMRLSLPPLFHKE